MKKYRFFLPVMAVVLLVSCQNKPAKQFMDYSQFTNTEYWQVVQGRAAKIVEKVELEDSTKAKQVQDLIAAQYYHLNTLDEVSEATIKKIKASALPEEEQNSQIEALKAAQKPQVDSLHMAYIKALAERLSEAQIDEVKNGMTYHVFPNTYAAFLDMLPELTEAQKKYIWDALYEAREHAMDAGSSKEKHGWFGKYKGRINNFLAKEGYDLNKRSKEWQERLKAQGVKL